MDFVAKTILLFKWDYVSIVSVFLNRPTKDLTEVSMGTHTSGPKGSASGQYSGDQTGGGSPPDKGKKGKKKDKKTRYSSGTKGAQKFEKRISEAAHTVTGAVDTGVGEYLDSRKKSSKKRKDGAVVESYVNIAKGISEGIEDASPALTDVAKAINSKRTRKVLRGFMKTITMSR